MAVADTVVIARKAIGEIGGMGSGGLGLTTPSSEQPRSAGEFLARALQENPEIPEVSSGHLDHAPLRSEAPPAEEPDDPEEINEVPRNAFKSRLLARLAHTRDSAGSDEEDFDNPLAFHVPAKADVRGEVLILNKALDGLSDTNAAVSTVLPQLSKGDADGIAGNLRKGRYERQPMKTICTLLDAYQRFSSAFQTSNF